MQMVSAQTLTSTFVPLRSIKLTLGFILADAVSFLLLVRFEVAANKNHTIFSGYRKVKGRFSLAHKHKHKHKHNISISK